MPKFLSFHSFSNLFSSASISSSFTYKEEGTHFQFSLVFCLETISSYYSQDLEFTMISLLSLAFSLASSTQHINWFKCFRFLKPPSLLAPEFYVPLHLYFLLLAALKLCSSYTEISDALSWFTSFLLLYSLSFAEVSSHSLIHSMPSNLSSNIPSSGKPSKTPIEELAIPFFYNFTQYQMCCDYLSADMPTPSDCRILVVMYKILLITCVFPEAGFSRS